MIRGSSAEYWLIDVSVCREQFLEHCRESIQRVKGAYAEQRNLRRGQRQRVDQLKPLVGMCLIQLCVVPQHTKGLRRKTRSLGDLIEVRGLGWMSFQDREQ